MVDLTGSIGNVTAYQTSGHEYIILYMAHAFYVILAIIVIAHIELIAILFGGPLLAHVVDTYLLPTLVEEWVSAIAFFTSALVVGMLVPYFSKNKWPYSHLLTIVLLVSRQLLCPVWRQL